eukprot:1029459-Pleurochrysis_carterae.AAC.1
MIASVSPNTQLVEVDCQSWSTESSESEKVGTQRTSRRVRSTCSPRESIARSGRSPMTEHRCVRPSTPVTRSEQGRVLIKSPSCG